MTEPERAAAGPMVAIDKITAAASDLLADDTARGRVVVLRSGRSSSTAAVASRHEQHSC